MEDAREARRKRLVNRGTDRLAFITGQTGSLPPPPPCPPPPAGYTQESNQISHVRVESDDRRESLPISSPPKIEGSNKYESVGNHDVNNNYSTIVKLNPNPKILTPTQIHRSILASENIRLICSVVIAICAVLSHHGYLLASKTIGNIFFRPLLLVVVTDAAIILGQALENQEHYDRSNKGMEGGNGWTNDVGKVIEVGLLIRKAFNAVSMDFSLCAVIMISGTAQFRKSYN